MRTKKEVAASTAAARAEQNAAKIRNEFEKSLHLIEPTAAPALQQLTNLCHNWFSGVQGFDRENFDGDCMLVCTELAEAVEADRKELMDAHLPDREGRSVEIADAFIRLFHLVGKYNLEITDIFAKMRVNFERPVKHGKSY